MSFVIPHWNRRPLLEAALGSIARLEKPEHVEIETIVVDNASADDSVSAARALGARVVELERNEGVSRALNRGIAAATGERVVLLNNDVELEPDWLARMLAAVESDGVWFAACRTLRWTDKGLTERAIIDGAGDALCRGGAAWRLGHGRADGPLFAVARKTYFPSATATLFRAEFFGRVGLLEEDFFAYLEDADLGVRAALADLPGVYVPEAIAYHRGSETAGRWSALTVESMTRHQILLVAKYYPVGLLLRFAGPILAAQVLWALLAASRGRAWAWLRGVSAGVRAAGRFRKQARWLRGAPEQRLAAALEAAEAEIRRFQRASGFDSFWKWYFRLAWPPVKGAA